MNEGPLLKPSEGPDGHELVDAEVDLLRDGAAKATGDAVIIFAARRKGTSWRARDRNLFTTHESWGWEKIFTQTLTGSNMGFHPTIIQI